MKRTQKLMLLASVLAVVVIAAVAVNSIVVKNEEETTTEENTTVTFLTVDPETVVSLSWIYDGQTVNLTYADGTWADADDAAFPVAGSYPNAMVAALTEVTASRSFTEGDLSEYGLDEPAYTIRISDGTDTTLTIGDASEISGEYYASIGNGQVYLVDESLIDPFSYGLSDILQMESIPDMAALTAMDIATSSGELTIQYMEDSDYSYTGAYHWFLSQNGTYDALGGAADTLAATLTGLTWAGCENYNASGEDLAAYGLDEPNATVTLTYTPTADTADETDESDETGETAQAQAADEEAFVLEIGGFTDGGYYARIQDSNMVYLIDASTAQSALNATYNTLRPTDVCLLDWDTVASFDVTLDGETYTFERSITETTDEDGNVTQKGGWLMNGTEVDADLVTSVLDAVYGMSSTGTTNDSPGSAEISFAFHRGTETFADIELAFYRLNSASCIVGFNGETRLTVARADVVDLIETVNAILLQ